MRFESDASGTMPDLQASEVVAQRLKLWKLHEGPGKMSLCLLCKCDTSERSSSRCGYENLQSPSWGDRGRGISLELAGQTDKPAR